MDRELVCSVSGCENRFLPSFGHKVSGVVPAPLGSVNPPLKVSVNICYPCYRRLIEPNLRLENNNDGQRAGNQDVCGVPEA